MSGNHCRRVAIHTLTRRRDDVMVGLCDLAAVKTGAAACGWTRARDFALLAHWTGAQTPLDFVSGEGTDALLLDAEGSAVHLQVESGHHAAR
jgi:hypothetical protein